MATKHKAQKSRLREKAARAPRPHFGRIEKSISKYLEEVKWVRSEPARLARFTVLLNELFGELDFPLLRDFLAGFEARISAHEGEKCGVLRGRADALYGNLVIEFERGSSGWQRDAKKQLQRYLAILRTNQQTRDFYFIPIASDGASFVVFAPIEGPAPPATPSADEVEIEKIEEFNLDRRQPLDFYFWLDRYFLREHKREPRTENFLQDFGPHSPAFRYAASMWLETAETIREQSDFEVIYDNWRKYLRIAYGAAVGDRDLFVRHTFLATLAKLIAYIRITNARSVPEENETIEIARGTFFEKQRIMNFLEDDFFSWVARPSVSAVTRRVVHRLTTCSSLTNSANFRKMS